MGFIEDSKSSHKYKDKGGSLMKFKDDLWRVNFLKKTRKGLQLWKKAPFFFCVIVFVCWLWWLYPIQNCCKIEKTKVTKKILGNRQKKLKKKN